MAILTGTGEGGSLVTDSKGNHVGMLVASAIKQDFSQTFVAVSCMSTVASHIKSYTPYASITSMEDYIK